MSHLNLSKSGLAGNPVFPKRPFLTFVKKGDFTPKWVILGHSGQTRQKGARFDQAGTGFWPWSEPVLTGFGHMASGHMAKRGPEGLRFGHDTLVFGVPAGQNGPE